MKKLLLFLTSLFLITFSNAQQPDFNLELIGHNGDYSFIKYNDIWGWVDGDGTEYAIIGSRTATIIYSLEDPANPQEIYYVSGSGSLWRDIKHWGDFIYVTTDQVQDGLLIIDMSGAPENITHEYWTPTLTIDDVTATLLSCHNLYIDENGYCYLSGCNMNGGSPIILDVATTPGEPIYVGHTPHHYAHDAFARGDTLWSADIYVGTFSATDVSDKEDPFTMASAITTFEFTHHVWLSDDGNYLFTADEKPNAFIDAYDVSDLSDIQLVGRFQPQATKGTGTIPHNTFYHDGYLVTSWYTDGVKITDAHRPSNMIEVGSFDTYDQPADGFNGCWGVYPFLPSGLLIASDINSGLYIFEPNYKRACYLEGSVTDIETGDPIFDVQVDIIETDLEKEANTDLLGTYKTGLAEAGSYTVTFTKYGYDPVTVDVELINGEVTILDVQLGNLPETNITGKVIDATTQEGIPNSEVLFATENFNFTVTTDANGEFEINDIFIYTYDVIAGAWGYLHEKIENFELTAAENVVIELGEKGYQDDFILDFGWATSSSATTGLWVREVPNGTILDQDVSNPSEDIDNDIGEQCYVTGNDSSSDPGDDDIDNGIVRLYSPYIDISSYNNPILSYNLWFFNEEGILGDDPVEDGGFGPPPNDTLKVIISYSPGSEVIVETVTESDGEWRPRSEINLASVIDINQTFRVIFESGDRPGAVEGHIVEAAIDAFAILDGAASNTTDLSQVIYSLAVSPNPFATQTIIKYQIEQDFKDARLHITNSIGQIVSTIEIQEPNGQLEIGQDLIAGIYFLQLEIDGIVNNAGKLIKTVE